MGFKKDEEFNEGSPAIVMDRAVVVQEARAFNESPIRPRKCRQILAKIVYLVYQSEVFGTREATDLFFSISKLFQVNDIALRQMVYLALKELSGMAENVFVVTSSLSKDTNAKADVIYRANAVRALCKITDASQIQSIDRLFKQAIVDQIPAVSSAAIVCSFHLFQLNREVVKRWVNEVQEALNSKGAITQYHALGLLYLIRQHDKMAIIKLIQASSKLNLRSPLAHSMLIRYASKIMDEEEGDGRSMFGLLETYLRHKSDMVVYEAAKAICSLKTVTQKELFPAVSALQLMLVNHKSTLRFAAIRVLNKVAQLHPSAIWPCNVDMENLVTDPNRSIATFAITTLLKTGTEASVDRLMTQINSFISEITDEFKVIVVDAIRSLCLKFPMKQAVIMTFLSNVLRDEGGFEYKRAIVEAIFDIIRHIPESKTIALSHLCEFIEDCEFTKLAVRILHLLGQEGPQTEQPSKYIRFIYNRVILENATVRASAVSALAKFAVTIPSLRPRILVLLNRCLDDVDDEVRDRAATYLKMIEDQELAEKYISDETTFAWAAMENQLEAYLSDPNPSLSPFDMTQVPIVTKQQAETEKLLMKAAAQDAIVQQGKRSTAAANNSINESRISALSSIDRQAVYKAAMEKIPSLSTLGPLLKSSKPVELTEAEIEYVVTAVKHVFITHLVFQFDITNTLDDTILEDVKVSMTPNDADETVSTHLQPQFILPIPKLTMEAPGTVYVVYKKLSDDALPIGTFSNVLKFVVKEIDPATGEPEEGGYNDEYMVEELEVGFDDFLAPSYVPSFGKAWDETGDDCEMVETYSLTSLASVQAATDSMVALFGMAAQESTDGCSSDRATTHTLLLAGKFVNDGSQVLARCRMVFDPFNGVTLELAARCKNIQVAALVANGIQ